jgi:integrase
MMLMAGENPLWVAKQMGHTDAALTLKRYARWIASDYAECGQQGGSSLVTNWSPRSENQLNCA